MDQGRLFLKSENTKHYYPIIERGKYIDIQSSRYLYTFNQEVEEARGDIVTLKHLFKREVGDLINQNLSEHVTCVMFKEGDNEEMIVIDLEKMSITKGENTYKYDESFIHPALPTYL